MHFTLTRYFYRKCLACEFTSDENSVILKKKLKTIQSKFEYTYYDHVFIRKLSVVLLIVASFDEVLPKIKTTSASAVN